MQAAETWKPGRPRAAALQLACAHAQEPDDLGGALERVGDRAVARHVERGDQAAVG